MGLLNKQKLFEKVQKIEQMICYVYCLLFWSIGWGLERVMQIWTSERFWEKKTEKPKDFDKICVWDGPVVVQMWWWKKVMCLKNIKMNLDE